MSTRVFSFGRDSRCWMAAEAAATYGTTPGSTTADPFANGDAIKLLTAKVHAAQEFESRLDRDNSRTNQEQVAKRISGTWSVSGYLLHGGTASGLPDHHLFFLGG